MVSSPELEKRKRPSADSASANTAPVCPVCARSSVATRRAPSASTAQMTMVPSAEPEKRNR
eukprot:89192-Prymnesium_polylepis.1